MPLPNVPVGNGLCAVPQIPIYRTVYRTAVVIARSVATWQSHGYTQVSVKRDRHAPKGARDDMRYTAVRNGPINLNLKILHGFLLTNWR